MTDAIYFYSKKGDFFDLSNFSPHGFEDDSVVWPTVEHYYQAQKFAGDRAAAYREQIRLASSPGKAKVLGRSRAFALRPDWDAVKEDVMRHALQRKFADPALRRLLLSTGDRLLVEASPHDKYWGCGRDGQGRNRLGVLLMELREELRAS
jgi:ribA/ribD-fused uncharacterized protein